MKLTYALSPAPRRVAIEGLSGSSLQTQLVAADRTLADPSQTMRFEAIQRDSMTQLLECPLSVYIPQRATN